jgi:hypothetical protein
MTVIRALPAITTYFCDTFLWYTFFATLFTVFLQWRGRITHAQNWAGGGTSQVSKVPQMAVANS